MNPESRLFIDGELCKAASGKTYVNLNPATEESMGEVADAGSEDMDRAIAAARRAFDESDWPTNHAFRLQCLQQLKDGLRAVEEDFKQYRCRLTWPNAFLHLLPVVLWYSKLRQIHPGRLLCSVA